MGCPSMKTTVTLDPDVHGLLREAALRSGKSFKLTLNDALRAGLRSQAALPVPAWPTFDMRQPLVHLNKAMALADGLDDRRP